MEQQAGFEDEHEKAGGKETVVGSVDRTSLVDPGMNNCN